MSESPSVLTQLRELFTSQTLAVLSTDDKGHPYSSLVAFAADEDLQSLYFATRRDTRKFANLQTNGQVALLVDNRANSVDDFTRAVAVTALGSCTELKGTERSVASQRYLEKHPHLEEFVSATSCALIQIRVRSFYLVSQFQNVNEYHVTP